MRPPFPYYTLLPLLTSLLVFTACSLRALVEMSTPLFLHLLGVKCNNDVFFKGWWQYDSRASSEIEEAYSQDKPSCQLLLAGYMYIIDFTNMVQYRQNSTSRKRKIKRDRSIPDKLGVAGISETVLKNDLDDVQIGLQRLLLNNQEDSKLPTSTSRADDSRFTRQDSENYGLESLGPEYLDDFDYRAVSPSARDGRSFRPRLYLEESEDEGSGGDGCDVDDDVEDAEEGQPLRIMSGSGGLSVSPAAFRPLALRSQGQDLSHETNVSGESSAL